MSLEDYEQRFRRNEEQIQQLRVQLWGTEGYPEKGAIQRLMMTEAVAFKLEKLSERIIWLLVATMLLAGMNLVINKPGAHAGSTQSTSVITSDAAKGLGAPTESARDYFLVSEVAAKEGKTERTILNYIDQKLIQPEPVETSRGWQISKDYKIPAKVAQTSDEYRKLPKISANRGSPEPP